MKANTKPIAHSKNSIVSVSIVFVFLLLLLNQPISHSISIDLQESQIKDSDVKILTTNSGVEFIRTPDSYFQDLPDWPYEAKYVEIDGITSGLC